MAQKVLVVDDEESILEVLIYNIEKAGFEVVSARDGLEGLKEAQRSRPDIAILDITMPSMDGLELCGRIRLEFAIPVILLTARDTEIDKIVGLELGADDYVTKPFSPRELIARIKAVLRRSRNGASLPDSILTCGALSLDPLKREVILNEKVLGLTAKEFVLLEYMMKSTGIALSRNAILDHVWGYDYFGDSRTVDVHIRRLREKVEDDPTNPRRIVTVAGVGYKMVCE
jgi:DNA-binding response OmpR family regulator